MGMVLRFFGQVIGRKEKMPAIPYNDRHGDRIVLQIAAPI
jgi:hypothetical protein